MTDIIAVISGVNPDVICIQETRQNDPARGPTDMLDDIATGLSMSGYVFGVSDFTYYGNGVIYNGTLNSSENHALTTLDSDGEARAALEVNLTLYGQTFTVISTHLATGSQTIDGAAGAVARLGQLNEVKTIVDDIDGFVIVAGDFNHIAGAYSYTVADSYWSRTSSLAAPTSTPAGNVDRDHIYVTTKTPYRGVYANQTVIIDDLTASDHQPVWSDCGYMTRCGS